MRTILYIIILLLSLSSASFAGAKSIYEIKQVEIIQKNPDFSTAREKAMTDAEIKAFGILQTKLLEAKIISEKKQVPTKVIKGAVDTIDVVSERMGGGAYKAKFDVTFSPSQVSQIFGVGFIEPVQDPDKFLIIPIKLENDQVKIWKHEWWKYWTKFKSGAIILPVGDLQDVQEVKSEHIAANNLKSLQSMAFRYGANNIVLVQSEYVADSNSLKVQLEKIKDGIRTVVNYEYPGTDSIGFKELIAASAKDIAFRLENDALTEEDISSIRETKKAEAEQSEIEEPPAPDKNFTAYDLMNNKLPRPSIPQNPMERRPVLNPPPSSYLNQPTVNNNIGQFAVKVIAPDLESWNRVRAKVGSARAVQGFQVRAFSPNNSIIVINHSGNIDDLHNSLADQGLSVYNDGGTLNISE